MSVTRYKMTVEYKGSDYYGWQRQPNVPSVQESVERAIHAFSNQEVSVQVAGRTDAGVHATGQVFHVDLAPFSKPMDEFNILKAINAHLRPQPISILRVEMVNDEFSARFDAVNKLYRYRIVNRPGFLTVDRDLAWHIGPDLDVAAMREGASHLIGHHDFSTFRASECQANSPMRTLDRLDISERPYGECGGREIIIETEGQSFLHHQVRNMVGTLSLVGRGKWQPIDVKTALEAKNRADGGPTAPADGLYLVRVDY